MIIYADEALIRDMDDKVGEQAINVTTLPRYRAGPMQCPARIGVTASRSTGWSRSIPTAAVSSQAR
jgi:hypothetical protein